MEEKRQELEAAQQRVKDEAEEKIHAEKEAKRLLTKKYRDTCKEVVRVCGEKMPSSKYDKFYLQEAVKRYPDQGSVDIFLSELTCLFGRKHDSLEALEAEFLKIIDKH